MPTSLPCAFVLTLSTGKTFHQHSTHRHIFSRYQGSFKAAVLLKDTLQSHNHRYRPISIEQHFASILSCGFCQSWMATTSHVAHNAACTMAIIQTQLASHFNSIIQAQPASHLTSNIHATRAESFLQRHQMRKTANSKPSSLNPSVLNQNRSQDLRPPQIQLSRLPIPARSLRNVSEMMKPEREQSSAAQLISGNSTHIRLATFVGRRGPTFGSPTYRTFAPNAKKSTWRCSRCTGSIKTGCAESKLVRSPSQQKSQTRLGM